MMSTKAVIYACSRKPWLSETLRSALSCKHAMPNLPRILYVPAGLAGAANYEEYFSDVRILEHLSHSHRPRLDAMLQCEYDRAIFADGDTLFVENVSELFELLDNFDIGVAVAPQHFHFVARKKRIYERLPPVSAAIPEWNTGIIAANVQPPFKALVRRWSELLDDTIQHGYQMDQPAFRSALVHSGLRVATIRSNYNFRTMMLQTVRGKVKILHGRGNLEEIARQVNDSAKQRVYTPDPNHVGGPKPPLS